MLANSSLPLEQTRTCLRFLWQVLWPRLRLCHQEIDHVLAPGAAGFDVQDGEIGGHGRFDRAGRARFTLFGAVIHREPGPAPGRPRGTMIRYKEIAFTVYPVTRMARARIRNSTPAKTAG